ncbi:hypothetical protein WJX74_001477 [Apatococcus lobatus]|uniref:Uncharacterized protein n=1 Tax=Apatococcus lobatus TaxID=904363 RepID=A0AAW1QWX3_9CHLO
MHTTDRDELCKPEEEEAASHAEAETGISGACSGTNGTANKPSAAWQIILFKNRVQPSKGRPPPPVGRHLQQLGRGSRNMLNTWYHCMDALPSCGELQGVSVKLRFRKQAPCKEAPRDASIHQDPEAAAKHRKTAQNWSPIWDPRTRNAKELWYLSSVDELAEGIQMAWFCDLSQWSTQNTHNIIFPFEIHIPANSSEIHDPIGR